MNVQAGVDCGGYYCAHTFYALVSHADRLGSPILRDGHGEALCGFVHIPPRLDNRAAVVDVVVDIVRGARQQCDVSRVLVTGFGPFRDVGENPSGLFITAPDGLARCASQLAPHVRVHGEAFATDDDVLQQLPRLLDTLRPHLVVSLGVHRAADIHIETRATDRGLLREATWRHSEGRVETDTRTHRALWRCYEAARAASPRTS